jgi:4-amino-4-deoxy-L-arabinose transferase-like glycosyltransferase
MLCHPACISGLSRPCRTSPLRISFFTSICLLCSAFLLTAHIGRKFSQDYDEGVYLCSARMACRGFPLFDSVFSSQPPVFIGLIRFAFGISGESVEVARQISAFFAVISLIMTAWLAAKLVCPWAGPVSVIGLMIITLFFEQSRAVQAEMPALGFTLLAMTAAYAPSKRMKWLVQSTAGLSLSLGVLCKLLIVPIIPLAMLLITARCVQDRQRLSRAGGRVPFLQTLVAALAFFSTGILVGFCIFLWQTPVGKMVDQVIVFHLDAGRAIPADIGGNLDVCWRLAEHNWLPLLLALAGLWYLFMSKIYVALWLTIWLTLSSIFLVSHSPLFERHFIILLPPLSIAWSACVLWLPELIGRSNTRQIKIGWLILLAGVACWKVDSTEGLVPPLAQTPRPDDLDLIAFIQSNTRPDDFVVSDQQMQVFRAGRGMPPGLCDTSFVRIRTGYLTDDEAIRASADAKIVVFWTGRLNMLRKYDKWVQAKFKPAPVDCGLVHRRVYVRD